MSQKNGPPWGGLILSQPLTSGVKKTVVRQAIHLAVTGFVLFDVGFAGVLGGALASLFPGGVAGVAEGPEAAQEDKRQNEDELDPGHDVAPCLASNAAI
ncbi:hypothetical protein [Pseudaestuariivita rosea]|uniref:hypothetical protein n=1 Tax=Pseudaestuariivita rosea TaxID=2763263 RepID=UPI001ABADD8F|nr:hypothetical protein [Pseudaestuariivita rosea]